MPDRILTTHVGSLPRPERVVTQLFAQDSGLNYDAALFDTVMQAEVNDVVARQVEARVDVVSDGEMSKISYATYIRHRLTGFELGEMPRAVPLDLDDFPEFKERLAKLGATPKYHRPICTGPIAVKDLSALHKDIANLKAACAEGRDTRPAAGARLHEQRLAGRDRGVPAEQVLRQPRALSAGAGRRDEHRVRGHRRGRA